jgi:hypothetical protein
MLVSLVSGPPLCQAQPVTYEPLRVHPVNPHYFLFRGRPTVLVGASEHYGSVINQDFDYKRYLEALAHAGLNATRAFSGTYRELESDVVAGQAGNVLAPKPNRFLAPWPRTSTPGATDGLTKFDVTRWDAAYFARLKDFARTASDRGIVVEIVLFSNYYDEAHWAMSPLNARNNINNIGNVGLADALSLKDKRLLTAEDGLVNKLAMELGSFDNVYFELCNEPFTGAEILAWESHIASTLIAAESSGPRHIIAQEVGWASRTVERRVPGASMLVFHAPRASQVAANYRERLPVGTNETGFDGIADAPYRVESWQYLLAGGAEALVLDYSFTAGHEDGSFPVPAGQLGGGSEALRRQLGLLRSFVERLDLVHMEPAPFVILGGVPADASAQVLAQAGQSYALYIHHGHSRVSEQQLSDLDRGIADDLDLSGKTNWYVVDANRRELKLQLDLPPGTYLVNWLNTKTGSIDRKQTVEAVTRATTVVSPAYSEDIALRLERVGNTSVGRDH